MFNYEDFLKRAFEEENPDLKRKLTEELATFLGSSAEDVSELLEKVKEPKVSFTGSQVFANENEFDDYIKSLAQLGPADFARMYLAMAASLGVVATGCRKRAEEESEEDAKEWRSTAEWVDSLCTEAFRMVVKSFPTNVLSNVIASKDDEEEENE